MAKNTAVTAIVMVVIGIVALQYLGIVDFASMLGSVDKTQPDQGGPKAGGVTYTTPQVTFQCTDLHNPQTSVSCGANYRINGGAVMYDTDGASIEISAGDEVEYLVNASNYYSEHGKFTMPEKNLFFVGVPLLNYDTSPSIKVYNEDDGLLNSATQTEALEANADDDIEIHVTSSYKDGIKGATFVVDYLKTNIDDITSDIGSDISEPDSLTHNTTAGRAAADTFAAFLLGDLNADTSVNKETKKFLITVDTGSTTYGTANMTFGIIDKDWYKDANGGFSYGYEEPEANTDQGQAHHIFDTLFYTDSS